MAARPGVALDRLWRAGEPRLVTRTITVNLAGESVGIGRERSVDEAESGKPSRRRHRFGRSGRLHENEARRSDAPGKPSGEAVRGDAPIRGDGRIAHDH